MSEQVSKTRRALVTGATGYVGSQLVAELVKRGWAVRALCRNASKAANMPWSPSLVAHGEAGPGEVELFLGDATNEADVSAALNGVDVAWYLLHSMGFGADFVEQEVHMARTFGKCARDNKVSRIVYLGGLHPKDEELSEHLKSRTLVGEALMESGVPVAALQAGVVVGHGSESYSMIRHLSERLPVAVAPRWIKNEITPIAIRDVLFYLAEAADLPNDISRTFDIGGPESVPYAQMLQRYAKVTGRPRRWVFTAPVTTPRLASHWIALVTPVSRGLAGPLVESLEHETVVKERDLEGLVGEPEGGLLQFDDALATAVLDQQRSQWRKTFASVSAAVLTTALIGSLGTRPNSLWYRSLHKPAWMPPTWAFPVAWTVLYADIAAVGALMMADATPAERRSTGAALGINLAINALWPAWFFTQRKQGVATGWAAVLALSSADLVRRAYRSAPQRGIVLAPYALWTGFATVLSATIARKNSQVTWCR